MPDVPSLVTSKFHRITRHITADWEWFDIRNIAWISSFSEIWAWIYLPLQGCQTDQRRAFTTSLSIMGGIEVHKPRRSHLRDHGYVMCQLKCACSSDIIGKPLKSAVCDRSLLFFIKKVKIGWCNILLSWGNKPLSEPLLIKIIYALMLNQRQIGSSAAMQPLCLISKQISQLMAEDEDDNAVRSV